MNGVIKHTDGFLITFKESIMKPKHIRMWIENWYEKQVSKRAERYLSKEALRAIEQGMKDSRNGRYSTRKFEDSTEPCPQQEECYYYQKGKCDGTYYDERCARFY